MVGLAPVQAGDGGIGGGAYAGGLGADDVVLAVRFIPDGDDFGALLTGQNARTKLGGGLMSEAVPHTEGELVDGQHGSAMIIIRGRRRPCFQGRNGSFSWA